MDPKVWSENGPELFQGVEGAYRRAIYRGAGLGEEISRKPHIGIANAFTEASPAYVHLRGLADAVKSGIWAAGGIPIEFGTFATCGNIAVGTDSLRYELAIRDVLAASIEIMASVHQFAGLVLISSTDSVIPGHIMGAARLNRPTVFVTGGPMLSGHWRGRSVTAMDVNEAVFGGLPSGSMTAGDVLELEELACPTVGACGVMGTANTMQILTEPLGLSLPATSTIPGVMASKLVAARAAGERIVQMVREGRRLGDILDLRTLLNATIVDLAVGGSTNAVLHLLSIARELSLQFSLDDIDRASRSVPCLAGVMPNGPYAVDQFDQAGGVPQLVRNLGELFDLDAVSADGRRWADVLGRVKERWTPVIGTLDRPHHPESGLAVLRGNLANNGAITRQTAVPAEMRRHAGPALVFDSDNAAYEAVLAGKVPAGAVVVVRYQGPRGAPGMTEMMLTSDALTGSGRNHDTALITDGRFSGFNRGPIVGHIDPEAAVGGNIALVHDGDTIEIDIPAREISLRVTDEELANRRREWVIPADVSAPAGGILDVYRAMASPASEGAAVQPWTSSGAKRVTVPR